MITVIPMTTGKATIAPDGQPGTLFRAMVETARGMRPRDVVATGNFMDRIKVGVPFPA